MTIEEKLQHFYDTSVAEAQTEAENTLEAHKKSLEEMLEKHKESRKMMPRHRSRPRQKMQPAR